MSYTKILDNLYLGNQYSTEIIKNVNLIISVGCNSKHNNKNIENLKISIRDKITADITPFIDIVCDLIHNRITNNQKILVHCKAGINRSPAFIIAYLVKYQKMDLDYAKNFVYNLRNVKFKENFMNQIKDHFSSL